MRVEVLGGLERRRCWSQDDKARIVEVIAAAEAIEETSKLLPADDSRVRSVAAARIGLIEIDLGHRRRIRVDAHVDPEALARVLEVLERR
jgi:transposase